MRKVNIEAKVSSILDDLDTSRTEALEGINTLPEPEVYTNYVRMYEERPLVQEESFLDLLISGIVYR